jgi:F0F1-type ATP synthase alpha subunit
LANSIISARVPLQFNLTFNQNAFKGSRKFRFTPKAEFEIKSSLSALNLNYVRHKISFMDDKYQISKSKSLKQNKKLFNIKLKNLLSGEITNPTRKQNKLSMRKLQSCLHIIRD